MNPVSFYCVADADYFLGAVAMINSLRLHGHTEPVYLLDLGLTQEQRALLEPEVMLVAAPADTPPWLAKTVAPLAHPAEVMVLIDADMVVTRPLYEPIETAREGRVVAFANDSQRFFERWGELLGLGPLERRTYVCSGLVAAGGRASRVLAELDRHQRAVEIDRGFYGRDEPGYPFRHPEQDVLNAILAASPAELSTALPYRLAPMPPFTGLRPAGDPELRCAYDDGAEPYVVHHFGAKPWLERLDDGVYSRLLRRALADPAAPIQVPRHLVPSRLRPGVAAAIERTAINARYWLQWRVTEPLGSRLGASSG